jgi:hypothetical protein
MAKKSTKWFKKVRGSYIPNSWQGWLCYVPYVGYMVLSYIYVMSVLGYNLLSLFIIIPNWVAAAAVMTWLASSKSK